MIDPALKAMADTMKGIGAKLIEIQARLDAVESFAVFLAVRQGIPQQQAEAGLDAIKQAAHQKRLEQIESKNPAAAAEFDNRTGLPDLPDGLL